MNCLIECTNTASQAHELFDSGCTIYLFSLTGLGITFIFRKFLQIVQLGAVLCCAVLCCAVLCCAVLCLPCLLCIIFNSFYQC
jgi:hypothetical protein